MKMRWYLGILFMALGLTACAGTTGEEAETPKDMQVTETMETDKKDPSERENDDVTVSQAFQKQLLTVERVLELSGENGLTWADFESYKSEDIGSGMTVLKYDMNDGFYLLIGGNDLKSDPMYIRVVSAWDDEYYMDLRNHSAEEMKAFFENFVHTAESVGIRGHIKEVRGDRALISSDTHGFPGIFWVTGVEKLAVVEELKGGTPVFVLMEDTGEQESDGLEKFRGLQLMALSQEQETGKVDILLTDAPALALTDPLSSYYDPFQIQSGNYTWDTGSGAVVACGASPLEEAVMERAARLKIPRYNGMEQVFYMVNTVVAPDTLVVRQWDVSELGREDAKEESITTYYDIVPGITLEKDKVYEFAVHWKQENLEENGFWGTAAYVLVTE